MYPHSNSGIKKGFTLAEVIIVVFIMGLVSIGLGQFLIDVARSSFITTEKLEINSDIRQFTNEMAEFTRAANHFYIYRSAESSDINDIEDRIRDGGNGDLLLLVYYEPWPKITDTLHYTKVIAYARIADPTDPNDEGPVFRYEHQFFDPNVQNASSPTTIPYISTLDITPEELLLNLLQGGQKQTVIQLSLGLADGQLFYNYLDRSIMIKAEIIHGNDAKRITDTYNYTVSPRG